MQQWKEYSEKFLHISPREQYLILFTGLIAIVFSLFSFVIDVNLNQSAKEKKQIKTLISSNATMKTSIDIYQSALAKDPNEKVQKQIVKYEKKLAAVDEQLLALTSGLIDPIQMRYALLELLKLQKGVSLLSFQLIGAQSMALSSTDNSQENTTTEVLAEPLSTEPSLQLYRHGIKLTLKGGYFQLRDYLQQLEAMSWTFFWQEFNYNLQEYPAGELEIEMYSLSTSQEFIGV